MYAEHMSTQQDTTRRVIVYLATLERGERTRQEVHNGSDQVGINTYADFESGKRWPRSKSLRGIEHILGWKLGIIDQVLASGVDPNSLELAHMRGQKSLGESKVSIQDFSDAEYFEDLPRRIRSLEQLRKTVSQDQYTVAASQDLGGVELDQIEDA